MGAVSGMFASSPEFGRQTQQFLGRVSGFDQFTPDLYRPDLNQFQPDVNEQAFTAEIMRRMQGQGPSVAELQMQRGLDQANAQALGLAASQRGVSPGLAARLAQQAQAQNAQNTVGQAGMLRAQEQLANSQLLGGNLESQRNARAMGQQLAMQRSLGENQLRSEAFNSSGNRGLGTITRLGQAGASAASMGGGGMNQGGVVGYADGGQVMASFANALGQQLGQMMATRLTSPDEMSSDTFAIKPISPAQSVGLAAPTQAPAALDAGMIAGSAPTMVANSGGFVPGQAQVPGDHEANDTVPALLSPGEIVVPRTVVQKGPEAASAFVQALMKRG